MKMDKPDTVIHDNNNNKKTNTLHREGKKKEKEWSFTLGKVDSLLLSSILQVGRTTKETTQFIKV